MSVADDAAALRGMADFTMALAATETVKNEVFECERQASEVLGSHPALADISAAIATVKENADALYQSIHLLAGSITGVADTLERGQ